MYSLGTYRAHINRRICDTAFLNDTERLFSRDIPFELQRTDTFSLMGFA